LFHMHFQWFDETTQFLQEHIFPRCIIVSLHLVQGDIFHRRLLRGRLEEEHILDEERKKEHLGLKCCKHRGMLMLEKDRVHGYIESKFQGPILEGPISITLACKNSLMIPS